MRVAHSQKGLALLMLVFVLALAAITYVVRALDATSIQNEKDKKTVVALAEAKAALLGFSVSRDLTASACGTNCARPGDLPCPDTDNDGIAESSCGNVAGTTGQTTRLGRLPWRTLGLSDLRDGDGERLWYAVSYKYKNNFRFSPLNSDTLATVTLRGANGNVIFDGTNDGVVAVIIAPREALTRQDLISQVRDGVNQNIASNYLDVALGEDNQNFIDGNANGFIMGPVKDVLGNVVLNDQIIAITRMEINQAMESRVLAEVRDSLTNYFATPSVSYYPFPADFGDATCLGNVDISTFCTENASAMLHGRIPATPDIPWDVNSILRGESNHNWFQLNAWREVLHYAVAPACVTGTINCGGGGGMLTLNNAISLPVNNKAFIVIAAGPAIGVQDRSIGNDGVEGNYLEGENILPLDNVYTRTIPITNVINDRAISQP
jgi:hypothetical protein